MVGEGEGEGLVVAVISVEGRSEGEGLSKPTRDEGMRDGGGWGISFCAGTCVRVAVTVTLTLIGVS